jgi:excisionase family DNA binding protein
VNDQLLEQLAAIVAEPIAERVAELLAERLPANGPGWRWVDVPAAAEYLGWPKGRVEKLTAGRAIPHYRTGGRISLRTDELDAWMAERYEGPARAATRLRAVGG